MSVKDSDDLVMVKVLGTITTEVSLLGQCARPFTANVLHGCAAVSHLLLFNVLLLPYRLSNIQLVKFQM